MSTEDEMTIDERRKYLRKRKQRYAKADRTEKSKLLDEMEQVTNLHRKYLIALMGGDLKRKPRRRQPDPDQQHSGQPHRGHHGRAG
jgi:hypothetical protein